MVPPLQRVTFEEAARPGDKPACCASLMCTASGLELFLSRSCRVKRGCDLLILLCVHIHCCGNGGLRFRSYSGSLLKSAKVTKTLLPHHSAPRLGSVCPNPGIAPRVAAMGHPWPSAAKPASLPVYPLRNACVRPAWLTGRPRSNTWPWRPSGRPRHHAGALRLLGRAPFLDMK